jgi:hypothetical protein
MKLLLIPLALIAFFGLLVALDIWWCGLKANDMGVMNKWTIVSGCLMSADGDIWVRDENFRVVSQ